MISFVLNSELISVDELEPSATLLWFIRTKMELKGTKEGCAAGDCGACTVALGELKSGNIQYQAINACITPLASVHGKHILTVEHLRQQGELHPVQKAMVECHASQCGFCTPGIVMSLFVWHANVHKAGVALATNSIRPSIDQALSGNLCRCTGYKPIFTAAEASLSNSYDTSFADVALKLKRIAERGCDGLGEDGAHFFSPASVNELITLLGQYPQARLIAGATDVGLEFTQAYKRASHLIYLGDVAGLKAIEQQDNCLQLGAALTLNDVQAAVQNAYPAFAELLQRFGSVQVRNQATLGGNIANASPIGDCPPVLLALGAKIIINGVGGVREVALEEFFSGYRTTVLQMGEFIQGVKLPMLGENDVLKVYKLSKRFDDDISTVCCAIWLRMDGGVVVDCRLGFGGMATTPARAWATESELRGKVFDEFAVKRASVALAQDFSPIDDVRATAKYRLAVAGQLLKRAQLELQGHTHTNLFAHTATTWVGGGGDV